MAETRRADIRLNLKELQGIAELGVRRAHTFMAVGLQAVSAGPPRSAALSSGFQLRFMPEPLPAELGVEVSREYEAWLVGAGLRELDHYFGLFADRVWFFISAAELHGTSVPSDHVVGGKFSSNTNVSRKIDRIVERIGGEGIQQTYFDAFSRARNALGHGAGRVRDRDTGGENALRLRWIAPDFIIQDAGSGRERSLVDAPVEVSDPEGASLYLKFAERVREFSIGEEIRLAPQELSEICLFYSVQSRRIVSHLSAWLALNGHIIEERKKGGPVAGTAPNLQR